MKEHSREIRAPCAQCISWRATLPPGVCTTRFLVQKYHSRMLKSLFIDYCFSCDKWRKKTQKIIKCSFWTTLVLHTPLGPLVNPFKVRGSWKKPFECTLVMIKSHLFIQPSALLLVVLNRLMYLWVCGLDYIALCILLWCFNVFVVILVYKHGWVLGAKCLYDLESWWPQTLPESAQMLEYKNPKTQKSESTKIQKKTKIQKMQR